MEDSGQMNIYENDIDLYLHQFMEDQKINDLRAAPQTIWTACLIYIQKHVFPDRKALKQKKNIYTQNTSIPTNCKSYDYELLHDIADYYIYLCNLYDKECSLYGFSKLLNIEYQLLLEWGNNYMNSNRLSTLSLDLYKKLTDSREQSLVAKLVSLKHPTSLAILLNHDYNYNLPGVSKEPAKKILKLDDLPQLGQVKDLIDD